MQNERLYYLLDQRFNNRATPEEAAELEQLMSSTGSNRALTEWMEEKWQHYTAAESLPQQAADDYFNKIIAETKKKHETPEVTHMPKRKPQHWLQIAAILLISLSGATLYYFVQPKTAAPTVAKSQPQDAADVAPGGNFATLTLADGSKLTLDSAANGLVAKQGNTRIVKLDNGQVKYESLNADREVSYNTMSTPNGGEYKLWLPDGTAVWLNAASSITYPTAFTGNKREVSITGEVYFEVTKNKQPFFVQAGNQTIEVLGTHFNINAYANEEAVNTTLTEGAVTVKTEGKTLRLKPGQQAQNKNGSLSLNLHPDIEETLAWKDGVFNFNGTALDAITRQLERWYDVKFVYKDQITEPLVADIPRNVNISKLLELFELTKHVRFSVQGKTITVSKF